LICSPADRDAQSWPVVIAPDVEAEKIGAELTDALVAQLLT